MVPEARPMRPDANGNFRRPRDGLRDDREVRIAA